MEINQLLEGSNNFKNVQADAARLAEKWAQSGLLEGYSNEIEKNNMAMILENQAKQIVAEQSSNNQGGASHGGGAGEQWAGVALPLVRKVFAQIAAKDFVSVQPMNLPSGLIFYLDFKYGTSTANNQFEALDNMYGNVSTALSKMEEDIDVKGGLYGAGRFAYSVSSSIKAGLQMQANSAALATTKFQTASVNLNSDFYRFNFDQDFSSSIAALGSGSQVKAVTVLSSDLERPDLTALRAFNLESTNAGDVQEVFGKLTKHDPATNVITFIVIESAAAAIDSNTRLTVSAPTQPTENQRGDFEDNPAGAISIPEINVELSSEAIVAKTRKLKAQWTPEFAQDLNAYHSIDAEAELTSLLSEYISMEIDLEILGMLIENAVTTERWSASSNKVWGGSTTAAGGAWTTSAVDGGGYYNTQGQWFQTLGTKIQKVSNKIHQKTLRGGANFLVVSPTVSTILESIPGYAAGDPGDKMDYAFGVQRIGQFNGRYKVYKNPYMTENVILMGYRGSQFLETGAAYCPYVPLMMTPLVYDPNTFTPRKGIMTRYAKKMIRPEFYGKIFVSDVATI